MSSPGFLLSFFFSKLSPSHFSSKDVFDHENLFMTWGLRCQCSCIDILLFFYILTYLMYLFFFFEDPTSQIISAYPSILLDNNVILGAQQHNLWCWKNSRQVFLMTAKQPKKNTQKTTNNRSYFYKSNSYSAFHPKTAEWQKDDRLVVWSPIPMFFS